MKPSIECSPCRSNEFHVVSLVCQLLPEKQSSVIKTMEKIHGVEVHGTDQSGKVIATIEGPNQSYLAEVTEKLQSLLGMLSVALIYHEYFSENDTV